MKILEIISEAKRKTSFKITKLKRPKVSMVAEASKERNFENREKAIQKKMDAEPTPKKIEFKKYPDSKAGVIAFLNDPKEVQQRFTKSLDLPTCNIHADPSVVGVWAVDSMKIGVRVIIYLGGYKDPFGKIREGNDFEEGGLPFSEMKDLANREEVTLKQFTEWEKAGNISPEDLKKLKQICDRYTGGEE
jgi:hypothetical protein